ncbi:winged helix-turn-helix domain-containing protein [Streptomyces sp. NPDC058284]|uniref:winged helix-turn-helix domain-containing protein n=1 Tax=unclassified Streptomyces TaxID=2593676 RepID=UPI00365F7BDB
MPLRIHFTAEDLARTRLSHEPRPLLELSHALWRLQRGTRQVRYEAWRREVSLCLPRQARTVFDLMPVTGWTPDFLTLIDAGDPYAVLDRARSIPHRLIKDELSALAEQQTMPAWSQRLVDDPHLVRALFDNLTDVYTHVLAPWWPSIQGDLAADRAVRTRTLDELGTEALLARLNPVRMRWNAPTLEVALPCDWDLHLEGQGLLLMPSVMGGQDPVITIHDSHPQPILSYPTADAHTLKGLHTLAAPAALTTEPPPAVIALLGRTRASVLHYIAGHPGCSTKELAARTGITAPSASEHATTLRNAELILTTRHRRNVLHTPTSLGLALLNTTTHR